MPYPPEIVDPMREELTRIGFREARTAEETEEALNRPGTTLLAVNSVCGCSGRSARPAVGLALNHKTTPDNLFTVFAGQDLEAVAKAREFLTGYPPSSPCLALLRDGKLVAMLERKDIEGRPAAEIAADLTRAFDSFCAPQPS